jgi:diguanylate cyclase (GGDEF)-like protein/PAS domain S-box-containing protein
MNNDQIIQILSVEDNPGDVRLLQEVLKSVRSIRFEWIAVANITEALQKIAGGHFDIILLDLSLSDSFGLETLTKVKLHARETPIVIMTGLNDEKIALEALGKGAQDYLVKGQVDGNALARVIRYAIQRKQTQEALLESQERYILAVKGSNDGVWDWNLETDRIYFSPRWKEILGYTDDEIGSTPTEWMSRVHEDDVALVKNGIDQHVKNLVPYIKIEYRMRHKNGDWRWILTKGLAVRNTQDIAYRMAGSQTDVTDWKLAEEKLVYNAFHDALTGLPSRPLVINRLARAMKRLERIPDYIFAVLFLDLDRFKIVNDSLGHASGDKLLMEVGQRLETCVRKSDTIARVGGDEFIIVCDHMKNVSDAIRVAERIKTELSNSFYVDGHEVFTRASIGIVVGTAEYHDPEEMVRDADTAMYRAKSLGGGDYQLFDRNMHARVVELLQLENNLRRAVNQNDFTLHYQPIVSLESCKILGFEALIRWPHKEKGLLMPSEFIYLAEETGLIIPIGEWVLKTACAQLSRWQKEFPADPPQTVSVNVSYKQFLRTDFVETVAQILKQTDIKPNSLCLEITESGIMKNPDLFIPLISNLKKLDVQIHLDDFGTGYSSLYYLHRFKVDKLKIDRSFVSNISAPDENFEVLRSIISLAHNLKIDIIAEGIETVIQLNLLRELKCQSGQGYLFSKPRDCEAITALIAQKSPIKV